MAYHHGNLREALLKRAAEVIAKDGVAAVTLRGLARDLGVSHAAPRRHFPDRDALLAELARDAFRKARATMEAAAERAGNDPIARYRALGRSYADFARKHRSYFLASRHPDVLAAATPELVVEQREWFADLRRGVEAARAAGWHPECDIESLVAFSIAGALGAALFFSNDEWSGMLGKVDLEKIADRVFDLIVHRSRTAERASARAPSRAKKKTAKRRTKR